MAIHLLSARSILAAATGNYADGGGLFLKVTDAGASWSLRYTAPDGRRREMGLGIAERSSLAAAGQSVSNVRVEAQRHRALVAQGLDPINERHRLRDEARHALDVAKAARQRKSATLVRVARQYHAEVIEPTRTSKHAAQWIASLERNVPAKLWNSPIDSVKAPELLDALAELRNRIPETSDRVRQRLEAIFDHAEFLGLCTENPARLVRRKLAERPSGRKAGHFKALPFQKVPDLFVHIRQASGNAARCLEFAILTAARTNEALTAEWSEFDMTARIWTVPADKMKTREPHTVYLNDSAIALLESQRGQHDRWVFPSPMPAFDGSLRPMSNMAMLTVLDRLSARKDTTVHGLCRSSFSSWANEYAIARPDVIEAALAHREGDKVRAAYNRAAFETERRALLAAWGNFIEGREVHPVQPPQTAQVLTLPKTLPTTLKCAA